MQDARLVSKERIGIELAATRRSGEGLAGGWSMVAWEDFGGYTERDCLAGIEFLIAGYAHARARTRATIGRQRGRLRHVSSSRVKRRARPVVSRLTGDTTSCQTTTAAHR